MLLLLLQSPASGSAPAAPTGVVADDPVLFSVPLEFTLPGGATAVMRLNGTIVATNVTSSPYTFAGVADGDTLSVRSASAGGESADVSVTFTVPTDSEIAAAVWAYGNRTLTG